MKKLESLKKLLEVVKTEDKLASGDYCSGPYNCVVGHLLKIGGVTNKELRLMDNGRYDAYEADYTIKSILNAIRTNDDLKDDFVKVSLEKLGFNLTDDEQLLHDLQRRNDNNGQSETIILLENIIEDMEFVNE